MKKIILILLILSPSLSFKKDSSKNIFITNQIPYLEPNGFFLKNYSIYLNPFDGILDMYFGIPDTCEIEIKIKNEVNNSLVAYLEKDSFSPGYYKVHWNGKNLDDNYAEVGIYIFELKAKNKMGFLTSDFVASSKLMHK